MVVELPFSERSRFVLPAKVANKIIVVSQVWLDVEVTGQVQLVQVVFGHQVSTQETRLFV